MINKDDIEKAFDGMNAELAKRGVKGEVYLVRGAVMCLAFNARSNTKDVDGWFSPVQIVKEAARAIAVSMGLPDDWLNDAAKAFLPENAAFELWRSWSNLEVSVAEPKTLLAMKCAAARTADDTGDIKFLAGLLGLKKSSDILALLACFYPEDRLPVRSRLLLEEMFDDGA